MKMTLYTANCRGNKKNSRYPEKRLVTDADSLQKAAALDHVCAAYEGHHRSNRDFRTADVCVLDLDNDHTEHPGDWLTPAAMREMLLALSPALAFAIVPSRNHGKEKDGKAARPRFHVYFPHRAITDADAEKRLKTAICQRFPVFDANALDAARFLFGNEVPKEDILWQDGTTTIDDIFPPPAAGTIPEGRRNATMSQFAGRVVKRYGATARAHEIFEKEAEKCVPPLEDAELASIWKSACRFGEKIAKEPGYIAPAAYNQDFPPESLRPADYSDLGQAKSIAREYQDELAYSDATDFLHYDGTRWVESRQDAVGAVEAFLDLQLADALDAVLTARQQLLDGGLQKDALQKGGRALEKLISGGLKEAYLAYRAAKEYLAFVRKRRDTKYLLAAMIALKPMVQIAPQTLDRDGFLLNTPAGTYDLRRGREGLRPHDPHDRITKITAVAPGDEGKDLWQAAVKTTFPGDPALVDYVQQIVGLCAIGNVYLEQLIICYGKGSNGKSTFWNAIARVLGSYSGSISADTLTAGCKRNVKPELAEAHGKRLLIAAELEEGMRLSTSIVKQLCSTDAIQGEKKYKAPFSFLPTHTLVLYTNHLPKVGARDEGIWRRLIVIPFTATIKGENDIKNYADFLVENAGPAILAWILEGAKKAIDHDYHLALPPCVQEAIQGYREDNDWLKNFIEACCNVGEAFRQPSGQVYEAYRSYCLRTGDYARDTTTFYRALEQAGFKRIRCKRGRFLLRLRLKENDAQDFAEA